MSLTPLTQRRSFRLWLVLAVTAVLYLALLASTSSGGPHFFRQLLIQVVLAFGFLVASAALIAQFVLPVKKPDERRFVVGRLLNFMLGERGPVISVQEGKALLAPHEMERRGPGVLLVDQASAAVLRTDVQFTRSAGPGTVSFTEPGEWLAESLDLRRQRRTLKGAPPPSGEAADRGEIGALAVTRDGIPISADLQISFMLARRTPIGRSATTDLPPYDVAEGALQRAVYGRLVEESQDVGWSELPLRMLADLWREQVKQRTLESLLDLDGEPLAEMEAAILSQLTRRDTQPTGGETSAPSAAARLLDDRGIRVLGVRILELHLPEAIRQERLQSWFEAWAGPVHRELAEAEAMEREARRQGQMEASAALAKALTGKLSQGLQWHEPLGQRDSLILIFEDAIELSGREPKLTHLLSGLREALDQIKARDSDCRPRGAAEQRG